MNQVTSSHKCFQCGSPLVITGKVTEQPEGSIFPQTTTTYRCTNDACQKEKDSQEAKRIKLKKDKEEADTKRAEQKLQEKKLLTKITQEESR